MKREEILEDAESIVTKGRADEYGGMENNFEKIAAMWSTYKGVYFTAHDVAAMMIMLKLARISTGKPNRDNWVDIAGYAACGGEVQEGEE